MASNCVLTIFNTSLEYIDTLDSHHGFPRICALVTSQKSMPITENKSARYMYKSNNGPQSLSAGLYSGVQGARIGDFCRAIYEL